MLKTHHHSQSILLIISLWLIVYSYAECSYDYNLQFVVDESGSIGSSNYQLTIEWLKSLIANHTNDWPTRISFYTFDSSARQIYSFGDTQSDTGRALLQSALTTEKSAWSGGNTYTLDALSTSLYDFEQTSDVYTSDYNFIYLVTDGAAGDVPCSGTTISSTISSRLSTYGITIITIGIGNFAVTSIDCLSTDANTHLINGFTKADFSTFQRECPDDAPTTSDDCCKNYDSCKNCINEDCTDRYCVWDTDTQICQDAYTDGYPTNYATSALFCPTTLSPTCSDCPCDYDYNVQFVIDESGSIGEENYQSTIDFVKTLLSNQINEFPTRVSVYSFDDSADQIYSFSDTQSDINRASLQSALTTEKLSYGGGGTSTADALSTAIYDFENSATVSTTDKNFIYLITDGAAGDAPCSGTSISSTISNRLSTYDITIITIGIGNFDVTSIDCLSTDSNTHLINGFTDDNFATFTRNCPDDGPNTSDDCCKYYYSCKTCINEDCNDRYCVWNEDDDVCQDAYTDGYPTNYATSASFCSTCCTDYSSCNDCTEDEDECAGGCAWDNDNAECINDGYSYYFYTYYYSYISYLSDYNISYTYSDDYVYTSDNCPAAQGNNDILSGLPEIMVYGVIIMIVACCLFICCYCCVYKPRTKKRQKQSDNVATAQSQAQMTTRYGRVATMSVDGIAAAGIKYVDQNGNPVVPPTHARTSSVASAASAGYGNPVSSPTHPRTSSVVSYVDQNGNPTNVYEVRQTIVKYVDQNGNPVDPPQQVQSVPITTQTNPSEQVILVNQTDAASEASAALPQSYGQTMPANSTSALSMNV